MYIKRVKGTQPHGNPLTHRYSTQRQFCPVCLSPWDGYPEWLGRILNTHYNSRDLASELIDGGDMSAAWGDENRAEYYSERGEDCPPRFDDDIFDFEKGE